MKYRILRRGWIVWALVWLLQCEATSETRMCLDRSGALLERHLCTAAVLNHQNAFERDAETAAEHDAKKVLKTERLSLAILACAAAWRTRQECRSRKNPYARFRQTRRSYLRPPRFKVKGFFMESPASCLCRCETADLECLVHFEAFYDPEKDPECRDRKFGANDEGFFCDPFARAHFCTNFTHWSGRITIRSMSVKSIAIE